MTFSFDRNLRNSPSKAWLYKTSFKNINRTYIFLISTFFFEWEGNILWCRKSTNGWCQYDSSSTSQTLIKLQSLSSSIISNVGGTRQCSSTVICISLSLGSFSFWDPSTLFTITSWNCARKFFIFDYRGSYSHFLMQTVINLLNNQLGITKYMQSINKHFEDDFKTNDQWLLLYYIICAYHKIWEWIGY